MSRNDTAEHCHWCDRTKSPDTCGMIYCPFKAERKPKVEPEGEPNVPE